MAVTTESTNSVKRVDGTLAGYDPDTFQKKASIIPFDFTQGVAAGDATSVQKLFYLPPGKRRLLSITYKTSAFGASRVLDIGNAAYTKSDGTAGSAAAEAAVADKDVSSAVALNTVLLNLEFDSKGDGVLIQSAVAGGTIPAGATINGWATYI